MLEDLPDDLIILILKKLDYRSITRLCEVSVCIKRITIVYKVIKECNISCSTLATVTALHSNFFKEIAYNMLKLNLCGVTDLCKSLLMPITTKLKNLKTLDVSFTSINLMDFMDIYKACPTIKDITINFDFGKKCSLKVPIKTLLDCQKVFQQIEYVHFIGNDCNLLYSLISLFILSLSKLKKLQYSVVEEDMFVYKNMDIEATQLDFDHFTLYISYTNLFGHLKLLAPFNKLDFNCYEYIILNSKECPCITSATQIFHKFFQERFDLKVLSDSSHIYLTGDHLIMLWKKEVNEFNNTFFDSLYNRIKRFFVYYLDETWNPAALAKNSRFCIRPKARQNLRDDSDDISLKKRRIAPPDYLLNYDEQFKDKNELELYLLFSQLEINTAITLPSSCKYLQKLTYLNLIGSVKYSTSFFNILFRSCVKLVTLNIDAKNINTNTVARSVPLSRTIKNFRIVGKGIDFDTVLTSLSQCPTLENVHIGDTSGDCSDMFDPTILLQKCCNLYCVYIYKNDCPLTKLSKQSKIINKIKAKYNKMYINFKVLKSETELAHVSNPYVDVFNLFFKRVR